MCVHLIGSGMVFGCLACRTRGTFITTRVRCVGCRIMMYDKLVYVHVEKRVVCEYFLDPLFSVYEFSCSNMNTWLHAPELKPRIGKWPCVWVIRCIVARVKLWGTGCVDLDWRYPGNWGDSQKPSIVGHADWWGAYCFIFLDFLGIDIFCSCVINI